MKLFKMDELDIFDDELDIPLNGDISNDFSDFEENDDILNIPLSQLSFDNELDEPLNASFNDENLDFDNNDDEIASDEDLDNFENDEDLDNFGNDEDSDFQGIIRTVKGAYLVYKRQQPDDTYEELWIYNVGKDMKRESMIRRAILSGTDINPTTQESENGEQQLETTSIGNIQYLLITGLEN